MWVHTVCFSTVFIKKKDASYREKWWGTYRPMKAKQRRASTRKLQR
jgi:hypothetical protein